MKPIHFFALLVLFCCFSHAQINGYAKITNISGNVLTLSNANTTYGSFTAGQKVIVIQMQGATISSTTNSSSFGSLSSLNSAGLYEVAQISAVNVGVTSMTLNASLSNSYDVNGGLQVVTYPQLGTTNYTTTADITGVAWDGNVGGVIAFYVNGKLFQLHNINANGIGFRGGAISGEDGSSCDDTRWRNSAGSALYAYKGEGIYITNSFQKAAKGKAVNGGGGGNVHNGGGGGGGNYSAGGDGYYGWPGAGCDATVSAGGVGGIAISSSASRVFMGGGGGGGQENDSQASAGAAGGGVILLKCDTIVVTGSCSSVSISANGYTAVDSGQDGAGGGGAGGTIVLNIKGFRVKSGCPLTTSADGGDGANVNHWDTHGSGGGGGQGAIYINTTTVRANSGGGPANGGIFATPFTSPLPVELSFFTAKEQEPRVVKLEWLTASELNNSKFEIFHSTDGGNWALIGTKNGAGTTQSSTQYDFMHYGAAIGLNYYKLKQVDRDGNFKYSPIAYSDIEDLKLKVKLFPNPSTGHLYIQSDVDISDEIFFLMDAYGQKVPVEIRSVDNMNYELDLSQLESGIYFICSKYISEKVVLRKPN
jgi:hypothetical protein